ncbi:MAG: hypothetical protein ACREOI_31635 [bacterium]
MANKSLEGGFNQGFDQGLDKGKLIGKIQFAQQLLKQPFSSEEELAKKTEEELKAILGQLEASLKIQ